jgi:hypothetical protein
MGLSLLWRIDSFFKSHSIFSYFILKNDKKQLDFKMDIIEGKNMNNVIVPFKFLGS